MEPPRHPSSITVPAGSFDCAVYETSLELKRVELECERTVLFAFEGDAMTVIHFDHPAGAGDHAAGLLRNIFRGL